MFRFDGASDLEAMEANTTMCVNQALYEIGVSGTLIPEELADQREYASLYFWN